MKRTLSLCQPTEIQTEALVLPVFEDRLLDDPRLSDLNQKNQGLLHKLVQSGELKGKPAEAVHLYRPSGVKAQRVLLLGAGKRKEWNYSDLRRFTGTAWRLLNTRHVGEAALVLPEMPDLPLASRIAAEGLAGATYEPDTYKSEDRQPLFCSEIHLLLPPGIQDMGRVTSAWKDGLKVGEAFNFTRFLINEPANRLPPAAMARYARRMAGKHGLRCTILSEKDMAAKGMNCLLAVNQGSTQPPRMIVLEYTPKKSSGKEDLVALVGKGVTFDSGGLSLKPYEGMEEMKADMSGAAVVLGVMQAIADLKPNLRILAVAPCVENMPGGSAIHPGDVVYAMNGKSVEIVNTDAEGRLILADALCFAQGRKPKVILDIATLTGACKVALGTVYAGLFTGEEELATQLLALRPLSGEKLWRLPLDEEYRRGLKSDIADLRNIGNRWGGAIYGAMFLENFVARTPWAHLDIASVDWQTEAVAHQAKGATGFGFFTLLQFLLQRGNA